jgi:hypothetical protein
MMKVKTKAKTKLKAMPTKFWQSFINWVRSLKTVLRSLPFKNTFSECGNYFLIMIVMPLYPVAVFLILIYFLTSPAQSGAIRRAQATEDQPTIVRLAKGRRTAIHFWEKPERVIAGSPGKVQIDFLGNDIAVSPLGTDPGNLLVYARGLRFVILFQMASEGSYDDVVLLTPGRSKATQAIHLDEDTYHIGSFKLTRRKLGEKTETITQVLLKNHGKSAVVEELGSLDGIKNLKCGNCLYSRADRTLVCPTPIEKVDCHSSDGFKLSIARVSE